MTFGSIAVDLRVEVLRARGDLVRLRVAVLRRPALHDVRDEYLLPVQADAGAAARRGTCRTRRRTAGPAGPRRSPGPSPMNMISASGLPSPGTACVRPRQRLQSRARRHRAARWPPGLPASRQLSMLTPRSRPPVRPVASARRARVAEYTVSNAQEERHQPEHRLQHLRIEPVREEDAASAATMAAGATQRTVGSSIVSCRMFRSVPRAPVQMIDDERHALRDLLRILARAPHAPARRSRSPGTKIAPPPTPSSPASNPPANPNSPSTRNPSGAGLRRAGRDIPDELPERDEEQEHAEKQSELGRRHLHHRPRTHVHARERSRQQRGRQRPVDVPGAPVADRLPHSRRT